MKILKELRRRLFENHYRIIEIERFKCGIKWYHVQKLCLFGWFDVGDCHETIEDARKTLNCDKNKYVVDAKVIEEI